MAYLTKDASGEEVVEAIVAVHRGMRYLPPIARDRLAERTSVVVELTPREHEVLTCITRGQSNRESPRSCICGKDGASSREQRPRQNGRARPDPGRDLRHPTRAGALGVELRFPQSIMRTPGKRKPFPLSSRAKPRVSPPRGSADPSGNCFSTSGSRCGKFGRSEGRTADPPAVFRIGMTILVWQELA